MGMLQRKPVFPNVIELNYQAGHVIGCSVYVVYDGLDWILVDVTDLPDVQVGDAVVLLGRDGQDAITAEEWAGKIGTITYEVFCNISKRVPRVCSYA